MRFFLWTIVALNILFTVYLRRNCSSKSKYRICQAKIKFPKQPKCNFTVKNDQNWFFILQINFHWWCFTEFKNTFWMIFVCCQWISYFLFKFYPQCTYIELMQQPVLNVLGAKEGQKWKLLQHYWLVNVLFNCNVLKHAWNKKSGNTFEKFVKLTTILYFYSPWMKKIRASNHFWVFQLWNYEKFVESAIFKLI